MSRLRRFRSGDEPALARICLETGDAGRDATALYADGTVLADVYALPYAARHPEWAWIVEQDDGSVAGYLVATPDTRAFEAWFRDDWWPTRRSAHPRGQGARADAVIDAAEARGSAPFAGLDAYPAHLHIDLLPVLQGQGWGRTLIETLVAALRAAGVAGVHLGIDPANTAAGAFYARLGFTELVDPPHVYVREV